MLLTQFILVDTHFVLSLLAALVTFAIAWLYFDAWTANKKMKETTLFFGFLLLALSFVIESVIIDQALLARSFFGGSATTLLKEFVRLAAYFLLTIGQIAVPLQPVPEGIEEAVVKEAPKESLKGLAFVFPSYAISVIPFTLPILATVTAFLYLKRATVGLENHLKPISLGFFFLALFELTGTSTIFRETNNIVLSNIVGPFGIFWVLQRVFLGLAVLTFGRWVWGYLLKRFDTQLFMIFTTSSLVIFLTTTIFFTYATLRNLTNEAFDSLKTDVGVLGYSIESKKEELASSAQVVAGDPNLPTAIEETDRKTISEITSSQLLTKKMSSLIVVSPTGEVLFKAEDPEFFGGSLSDNSLVKRALAGEEAKGVSTKDGSMAPTVTISAAVPIKSGEKTVGSVLASFDVDNSFVDGVKSATGMDTSVYADNIRSATTFTASDGVSRWVGIKEETESIKKKVLVDGEVYTGSVTILNSPYFASFSPLKDVDGNPVGMLFTGRAQVRVLETAASSLELTFMVTAALLVLSLIPSYFVSKYIASQVR